MGEFREWLNNTVGTENVESKIDHLYDKAKYAIKLVQLYDSSTGQNLLTNISTIAELSQAGLFGLYNSKENKDVIGHSIANKTRFKFGQETYNQNANNPQALQKTVVGQYAPNVNVNNLVPSDVIHINVHNIVSKFGDSKEAIIEIASTIVHECTHDLEYRKTGKTDETGLKEIEDKFKAWVQKNWNLIKTRIPQINF
jgi:hypothetical protein